MYTEILQENVLTDDVIHYPNENKIFKGGYIAIVEHHTFLNSWNDQKHIKKFRNEKSLSNFLNKNYPNY